MGPTSFLALKRGKALIPPEKIRSYLEAYRLPFFPTGRLILVSMHPDIFDLFTTILTLEPELANCAKRCHVKNAITRRKRIEMFDNKMKSECIESLRFWLRRLGIDEINTELDELDGVQSLSGLFSLYLKMYRSVIGKKNEGQLSLDDVTQRLRHAGPQMITNIEAGRRVVPIDKIRAFQSAYELEDDRFSRLALACMHPEIYTLFIDFLKYDRLFAKSAKECHVSDERNHRKLVRTYGVRMRNEAFAAMRSFFTENEDLVPVGIWSNRMFGHDSTSGL